MMITEKLYDVDAYATEFEASVLSCEPLGVVNTCGDKSVIYAVVLNQTLFFPEDLVVVPNLPFSMVL